MEYAEDIASLYINKMKESARSTAIHLLVEITAHHAENGTDPLSDMANVITRHQDIMRHLNEMDEVPW